jgi:transcriptional regulator with XRE-family HTH domain
MLNWTQEQLATNARVARATVADFESNARQPMKNNVIAMAECMYVAGIDFVPEDGKSGVGVRFRERKIEYIKDVSIDRFNRVMKMRMRYSGSPFVCLISLNAIDDYFRTNFSEDDDYARAGSDMLHHILVIAEQLAPTGVKDGKLLLTTEVINAQGSSG